MRITYHHLRRLPVFTERGTSLGVVVDIELDVESHAVIAYLVQSGIRWLGRAHRISPSQVISITNDRMTVKDAVIPEGIVASKPEPAIV